MNTKPKNCSATTVWPFPTAQSPLPSKRPRRLPTNWAYPVVVKAQIHAGGRGLGGGVKVAKTPEEFDDLCQQHSGDEPGHQTDGTRRQTVKKLLIEQGLNIAKELYLSILPDRATAKMIIMASEAGGMDIEDVAEKDP
jgi:succinyl-CoA synthetase beta subunit